MTLAFLTGALASGLAAAGLTGLLLWILTVLSGSTDPWSIAPWVVAAVATLVVIGTFIAEKVAYRRTMARMRAVGEPWAFRQR